MYLYLGQNTVVRAQDIVGIFDMENTTVSKNTRAFLAAAQKAGRVFTVSPELPKSFILCKEKNGRETVYISQISTATLLRRYQRKNGNLKGRKTLWLPKWKWI